MPWLTESMVAPLEQLQDAFGTMDIPAVDVGGGLHPTFFTGEAALSNGVYYLALPDGNPFGYCLYLYYPSYPPEPLTRSGPKPGPRSQRQRLAKASSEYTNGPAASRCSLERVVRPVALRG